MDSLTCFFKNKALSKCLIIDTLNSLQNTMTCRPRIFYFFNKKYLIRLITVKILFPIQIVNTISSDLRDGDTIIGRLKCNPQSVSDIPRPGMQTLGQC